MPTNSSPNNQTLYIPPITHSIKQMSNSIPNTPTRPSPLQRLEQAIVDRKNQPPSPAHSLQEQSRLSPPLTPPRKSRSRSRERRIPINNWQEFAPRKSKPSPEIQASPQVQSFSPPSPKVNSPREQTSQPTQPIECAQAREQSFELPKLPSGQSKKDKAPPTEQDLKRRRDHFKTKICQQFVRQGKCRNGEKCDFAHGESEIRKQPGPLWKTDLCFNFRDGICKLKAEDCKFAHGQSDLRQKPQTKRSPSSGLQPGEIIEQKKDTRKRRDKDRPNSTTRQAQRKDKHSNMNSLYQIDNPQVAQRYYYQQPPGYPYYYREGGLQGQGQVQGQGQGQQGQGYGQEFNWQRYPYPPPYYNGFPPLPSDYVPPPVPYSYPPFHPYYPPPPPASHQQPQHPAQAQSKPYQEHVQQDSAQPFSGFRHDSFVPAYNFPYQKGSPESLQGSVLTSQGYGSTSSKPNRNHGTR